MSSQPQDIDALRAAKEALIEEFGAETWFSGAGIARTDQGLGLRLNVDPDAEPKALELPKTYRGFAVEVVRIGRYRPRGGPAQ